MVPYGTNTYTNIPYKIYLEQFSFVVDSVSRGKNKRATDSTKYGLRKILD